MVYIKKRFENHWLLAFRSDRLYQQIQHENRFRIFIPKMKSTTLAGVQKQHQSVL